MSKNRTDISDSERILLWIRTILREAEKNDGTDGQALLYACGKACAASSSLMLGAAAVRKELPENADVGTIFKSFKQQYYNTSGLEMAGNRISLVFTSCTCSLAKEGIDDPFLCRCTVGYSKALFETLFGRSVEVTLHASILNGDRECRQSIVIQEK